ncbi:MAG: hypothetical protein P1U52_08905 [Porticoccaceae bacterium]|nr:hypothetical protein [Porticoccaceae bacterium]
MDTTKITVKILDKLLSKFNEAINSSFIKKDAFLNYIIESETKELATELDGFILSGEARRYISGALKKEGTRTVNITVNKSTAEALNTVVSKTNISRDAFINRLIYFLLGTPKLLKTLELPRHTNHPALGSAEDMETSPLPAIASIMKNPLFYLRIAHNEIHGCGLYSSGQPIAPNLHGLCCNIDDIHVPGTKTYRKEWSSDDL